MMAMCIISGLFSTIYLICYCNPRVTNNRLTVCGLRNLFRYFNEYRRETPSLLEACNKLVLCCKGEKIFLRCR